MKSKKIAVFSAAIAGTFVIGMGLIASTVSVFQQQEAAVTEYSTSAASGNGSQQIVEVALREMGTVGGAKYRLWYTGSADGQPWCATFVSWCADQLGFIESGIFPKFQGCTPGVQWFEERGEFHYTPAHGGTGYTPKAGDIIFFDWDGNVSWLDHVGIVQFVEGNQVITVEGNTGDAVGQNSYNLDNTCIIGYAAPSYPVTGGIGNVGAELTTGQTIIVPSGLGSVHSYMGWQLITATGSMQYKLREDAGMRFDSEGFGVIGDRYVIACTTTYGAVGDRVDFYQEDGTVIKGIIGDIKNQTDPGCNQWGHLNGTCIIEFVVDRDTWYYNGHANPGTAYCHPEWNQNITKVVNRGSFWSSGGGAAYNPEKDKDPEKLMKEIEEERKKDPANLLE